MDDLVERALALRPLLRAESPAIEAGRMLTEPALEALHSLDAFRALVPASVGGKEISPRTFVEMLEALSMGDSAVGWCAMVTGTTGLVGAYLAPEVARAVWPSTTSAACGVFAPMGRAVREGDGFRLSGRWPFASACQCSPHRLVGFVVTGGERPEIRQAMLHERETRIVDTWNVSGLRGTGSHDLEVDAVLVPAGRTVAIGVEPARETGSLYRFPLFGILAAGVAAVALGVARGALEACVELARTKKPMGGKRSLAERELVQADLGRASAAVRSGRAWLLSTIDELSKHVEGGDLPTLEQRAELRLAAAHATERAAVCVDLVHRIVGSTGIYEAHPFARAHRDVHVATQHAMVADAIHALAGRVLAGLPTEDATL